MSYPNPATAAQQQTRVALEAMRAYFVATAQARPRKERQQLANEWLNAVRQMRVNSTLQ
jgi:hypothetical protein